MRVESMVGQIDSLHAQPAAALTPQKKAQLAKAAGEFEASMLGEMLKPLGFGAGVGEDQDALPGGAAGSLRDIGTQALSKALADAGGVGVARQIIKKVTAEHEASDRRSGGTKVP